MVKYVMETACNCVDSGIVLKSGRVTHHQFSSFE